MALTVGTDTYISLADADTYLSAHYITTDSKLVAWNALTDANCEILLRKAAQILERTPVVGIKVSDTQTMQFPRAIPTTVWRNMLRVENINIQFRDRYYIQTEVPDAVKYAQCEIAIDLVSPSDRVKLQREGVKSFSIDGLSESYGSGRMSRLPFEAKELLKPYALGGAPIC
jgi:hypothetical protein